MANLFLINFFNNKITCHYTLKFNIIFCLYLLIIINHQIVCAIIKIPFKIVKYQKLSNQNINQMAEDISLNFKVISLIKIGEPQQEIEASFHLKFSNFYISYFCKNSSTFYSYKDSKTFSEIKEIEEYTGLIKNIYFNETFYFQDAMNNKQITVDNMLIYIPNILGEISNCLNIGLNFPDNANNKYQETFIQQLKHKNIINKYCWIMELNKSSSSNNNYDGQFIFGDILNDYYAKLDKDFSMSKIVYTYTANVNKKIEEKNNTPLNWGIFFQAYYEIEKDNEKYNIFIGNYIFEFDFGINLILGTVEYFKNIQRDYFDKYINQNICKTSFIGSLIYKFIYCYTEKFTLKDLVKFPSLNLKSKDLNYIYSLDYQDLFYLTLDKKYYIFNIMINNHYENEYSKTDEKWVLGLAFLKKYHFIFDVDNKLLYYYNKNIQTINEDNENINNYTNKKNNQGIKNDNTDKKNTFKDEIKVTKLIFIIILFLGLLFCFLVFLIRMILFKKGYILVRNKKANELEDEYCYTSKNSDLENVKNNSNEKKIEMQIKSE